MLKGELRRKIASYNLKDFLFQSLSNSPEFVISGFKMFFLNNSQPHNGNAEFADVCKTKVDQLFYLKKIYFNLALTLCGNYIAVWQKGLSTAESRVFVGWVQMTWSGLVKI